MLTQLEKQFMEIVGGTASSDILNENANKDSKSYPTQRDMLAGTVSKHMMLEHILPEEIAKAHKNGVLHYHDMDYDFQNYFNCMLVDVNNMLTKGFKMGNAEIDTPQSITTATAITAQIIFNISQSIYGGTSIQDIDLVLAPYVKKSYEKYMMLCADWGIKNADAFCKALTEKEVYDAFQGLEYEINTLVNSNGQTPFVTLNFGRGTAWEERLIQEAILKVRIKGLGKNGNTPVFPKLVFNIQKGVNFSPEDPNYDIKKLALLCSSKRMYPDILNVDLSTELTGGSFKGPMGCRSFLGYYENEAGESITHGRNNLGVTSLNLVRIGIISETEEEFYENLDEALSVCKTALDFRLEKFKKVQAKEAPLLYMYGACGIRLDPEEYVFDKLFANGRASISLGYIGVNEAMNALYGADTKLIDSVERQDKALEIVQYIRDRVEEWKKESGIGFSLYSTPSESLCNRFHQIDKAMFGEITGVTDKGYYTNSFHLCVLEKVDPFTKVSFESPYHWIASGGHISYAEFPDMKHNLDALEAVWDYTYDRVPYFGTNLPADKCHCCGYEGEFKATKDGFTCPKCGNDDSQKMNVIRRVCGYLGQSNARPFNKGKQQEVINRVKHVDTPQQSNNTIVCDDDSL